MQNSTFINTNAEGIVRIYQTPCSVSFEFETAEDAIKGDEAMQKTAGIYNLLRHNGIPKEVIDGTKVRGVCCKEVGGNGINGKIETIRDTILRFMPQGELSKKIEVKRLNLLVKNLNVCDFRFW